MTGKTYIVIFDTPSVKQFVFGTDSLREVRGASALLDRLNRNELGQVLERHLGAQQVWKVYANGGSGQFRVQGHSADSIEAACMEVMQFVRVQTGGEVKMAYGYARLGSEGAYQQAVAEAHFRLRCHREFDACRRSTPLLPMMMECQSASHLPAAHLEQFPEGPAILSRASHRKRKEVVQHGLWEGWMQHLSETEERWPDRNQWSQLRCENLSDIGGLSTSRNRIGVVYADGNAMGRIVQQLDSPEVCKHFSETVDTSIRDACHAALTEVSKPDIADIQDRLASSTVHSFLRADILLLGGDDLLVALPAERALEFAMRVTQHFERLTAQTMAAACDEDVRNFYRKHANGKGFTISCGVAIVSSSFPFYLSLDLAEDLLKNAKAGHSPQQSPVARIDFHVVAGSNSYALKQVRSEDYGVASGKSQDTAEAARTLRPLTRSQLEALRDGVDELRRCHFPRSKLHDLHEAALDPRKWQAEWRIREIFARSRHGGLPRTSHRYALWHALDRLRPAGHEYCFPWFTGEGRQILGVADLVEAYDLFPKAA